MDPDDYYDSCVYDVCLTGDDALCASLAQYARACRSKGGKPGRWRLLVEECRKSLERRFLLCLSGESMHKRDKIGEKFVFV